MINSGGKPAVGGMAGGTVGTELAIVFVILGMAGIAVLWGALEHMVYMTILAGYVDVFACKFKGGKVMIEQGWRPAGGGVTGTAVIAKAALVGVVFCMAGKAVLRRGL